MAYRIERIIPGGFHDYLMHLWEGSDLPVFIGSTQRAYLFDDKAVADRVAQRLASKCPETMATPHLTAKPITYEVVEVSQHAWGRYMVFSNAKYKDYPNVVPAGRYDNLDDAKKHADSVTYKMAVVDSKAESRGFIYCNWESPTPLTPDNSGASQLACNIVNNTFLSLDGFEAMRKQMAGTTYTAEHFGAELARIVDRKIEKNEDWKEDNDHDSRKAGVEGYDDDDEEQEVCPQCGHSETSDGYGGNDCPDCWGERGEKVVMQVKQAAPIIQAIDRTTKYGSCTLVGFFSDNAERKLFSYYIDELSFADSELIGLTEEQAHQLRTQRDVAYLRS